MDKGTSTEADVVRRLMRERGHRQVDVAVRLGISQPALSSRLCGHTPFTLAELRSLAVLLDVSLFVLLAEDVA